MTKPEAMESCNERSDGSSIAVKVDEQSTSNENPPKKDTLAIDDQTTCNQGLEGAATKPSPVVTFGQQNKINLAIQKSNKGAHLREQNRSSVV